MIYDLKRLIIKGDAPLASVLAVETGPGKFMEIDRFLWEATKDDFVAFCESLPTEAGPSYQVLKAYTQGNGDLAKLLIALGALAGVWKMHPDVRYPELWGKSRLYPMVQAASMKPRAVKPPRVPKPSAGGLEVGVTDCTCCNRPMGPADSVIHDLVAGRELCAECEEAGCNGETCIIDRVLTKPKLRVVKDEEDDEPEPDGMAAYLAAMNGGK